MGLATAHDAHLDRGNPHLLAADSDEIDERAGNLLSTPDVALELLAGLMGSVNDKPVKVPLTLGLFVAEDCTTEQLVSALFDPRYGPQALTVLTERMQEAAEGRAAEEVADERRDDEGPERDSDDGFGNVPF